MVEYVSHVKMENGMEQIVFKIKTINSNLLMLILLKQHQQALFKFLKQHNLHNQNKHHNKRNNNNLLVNKDFSRIMENVFLVQKDQLGMELTVSKKDKLNKNKLKKKMNCVLKVNSLSAEVVQSVQMVYFGMEKDVFKNP
jgi:hypothetical protein